jgi:hypothetical protein
MFRISNGLDRIIEVAQIDEIGRVLRALEPGCYYVDEISADLLPGGHSSRRWGVAIKKQDGSVVMEADPWERTESR